MQGFFPLLTLPSICFKQSKSFPSGLVVKNPSANAGDAGLIPGSGRSPGVGNGNPLQFSCQGNPIHRGAWRATVHGITESDMTKHTHTCKLLFRLKCRNYFSSEGISISHNVTNLKCCHDTCACMLSHFSHVSATMDYSPPGSCLQDFPGKDTGMGWHALLPGIMLTQGSNPGLLHCRQIVPSEPSSKHIHDTYTNLKL